MFTFYGIVGTKGQNNGSHDCLHVVLTSPVNACKKKKTGPLHVY